MMKQVLQSETKIKLLGSSQTRVLNLDEEIAFLNFLKIGAEEIDGLTVQAFPRLEMQSTKSIFTTSKYTLSPKRSNNCALLTNGMFFFIEFILLLTTTYLNSQL